MLAVKRIIPMIILIALGVMLSSDAYAAVQKGYVRDQYENPIVGVHVVNTKRSGPDSPSRVLTDPNGYYSAGTTMYIDSISITELTIMPEPSSTATLMAGTAGIICFARRRKI